MPANGMNNKEATMTNDELKDHIVKLAGMVMAAQKKYFSGRTHESLVACKQLEKELDDALAGKVKLI